jgi:hypothetical protein
MIEMEQTERRWRLARRKTRTIFTTHHQCIHRVFKRVYFHRIQQTTPTRSTSHQPLSKDRNTRRMKQKNIHTMLEMSTGPNVDSNLLTVGSVFKVIPAVQPTPSKQYGQKLNHKQHSHHHSTFIKAQPTTTTPH